MTRRGFFSLILAKHPTFDVYEIVMKKKRWAPYLSEIMNLVSPYYKSQKSEKDLQAVMRAVEFQDIVIEFRPQFRKSDVPGFKNIIKSAQPEIPENQLDEYLEDCLQIGLENGRLDLDNGIVSLEYKYILLFAFGRKSLAEAAW